MPDRRRVPSAGLLALGLLGMLLAGTLPPPGVAASPPGNTTLVTVTETGLPAGTPWYVQLQSGSNPSHTPVRVNVSSYSQSFPRGGAPLQILVLPSGPYEPHPNAGSIYLFNATENWSTTFVKNTSGIQYDNNSTDTNPPTGIFGATTGELEFLGIGGGLAVAAFLVVFLTRKPPKRSPRADASSAPGKPKARRSDRGSGRDEEDPDASERRRARRARREGAARGGPGGRRTGVPSEPADGPDGPTPSSDDE